MPFDTIPAYDTSDNETGCCPRFNAAAWDGLELHFENKLFVRARTHAVFHVPLDMGRVYPRVQAHLEAAGAFDPDDFLILSRDPSPWISEHLFAASREVPDEEMTRLTGTFLTKVFDGPFSDARRWYEEMRALGHERGRPDGQIWFYYTTCPKCAEHYGHNYVVGFVEI